MERKEYDTSIELLGHTCGVTIVYLVGSDDSVYIEHVYGPSGKDIYEELARFPNFDREDTSLVVIERFHPMFGVIPSRLRWHGYTQINELYDVTLYAHRSGR